MSQTATASHEKPRSILIVGGGTAGWMTAASLARAFGTEETGGPSITVVESPEIGSIGVGEGTFPTIRTTLRKLGIEEGQFIRESSATFKQGILFRDWEFAPQDGVHNDYFHPFDLPYLGREELDLVPYWLIQDPATRRRFAEAVTFQKKVADAAMAPKRLHQGHYAGPLNYAYHFDATRFALTLANHARSMGVRHLKGNLNDVVLTEDGAIAHITTAEHGDMTADLFIDCTGFRSELLGKALGVPFQPIGDVLFTDRAVAIQVPYDRPDAPIASYTISSAHEAGWTWDIGLDSRRGIGYVYSSAHTDAEAAERTLRNYVGPAAEGLNARHIQFEAGYRTRHWVKNCVAIGLSGGFLEPLESTGIVLIETSITKLIELFPHAGPMDAAADQFNDLVISRYNTIIGFIKLHYCLTKRQEPFWRDNTVAASIPDRLNYLLAQWKLRPPCRFDFTLDNESFAYTSYQFILYGMNFMTDFSAARAALPHKDLAEQIFQRIDRFGDQACKDLVGHRQLIKAICTGGFTDVTPAVGRGAVAG